MARTRLGAQDDQLLLGPDDAARIAALKSMIAAGAKDLRVNAIYSKTRGGTDWASIDRLVNQARFMGLHPQMTLMADPAYHGEKVNTALSATNSDPRAMAAYAKAAAEHFKGRVGKYSIGNEVNLGYFLQSKHPAKTYRKLYDAGRFGVASVDPGAQVDFGELAPVKANQFIRRAVGRGGVTASAIALHPYGDPRKRSRRDRSGDITHLQQVQDLIARLHRQGKLSNSSGGRPGLDLTEYGTHVNAGSEAHRAKLFALAMKRAKKAGARQLIQYQLTPKMAEWDTSLSMGRLSRALRR